MEALEHTWLSSLLVEHSDISLPEQQQMNMQ